MVSGYTCSPLNSGSVCSSVCGDGILVTGEQCDNGNQAGCANCLVVSGYSCTPYNSGSSCTPNSVCGDGILATG